MLKKPEALQTDPLLDSIARVNGNSAGCRVIGEGLLQIGHFSSDMMLYGRNGPWDADFGRVPRYGVCDSPKQFLVKFEDALKSDHRNLAVFFTYISKDPSNAGHGGGWRWHKWGEYIGAGEPTTEYLDDETAFDDGVYVFHVHDIDWKPEPKKPFSV